MSVSNAHAVSKLVAVERVGDQVQDWVSTEIWGEQYFYWFATSSKKSDFLKIFKPISETLRNFLQMVFPKSIKKTGGNYL